MESTFSILAIVGFISLFIERIFYYKSKYKSNKQGSRNSKMTRNPYPCQTHDTRITALEVKIGEYKDENKEDHNLIRSDIKRIFELINYRK